jgi:hypothetical protein
MWLSPRCSRSTSAARQRSPKRVAGEAEGAQPPHRSAGPPTEPRRRERSSERTSRSESQMAAPGPVCHHRPGPGASPETGQETRVRTCCIGAARRRYAATVNSACQAGDLDALWAAPARAWSPAVDMHRPQDAETVAYAGLAPSRCGAPRRTTPRAWRIGWDACRCHHPRLAYEWLSAVAGGLRTPAMPATDRSGRGQGRAMTPNSLIVRSSPSRGGVVSAP